MTDFLLGRPLSSQCKGAGETGDEEVIAGSTQVHKARDEGSPRDI